MDIAESKEEEGAQKSNLKNNSDVTTFKPGQKFPTPSPGSGDRVFYETLLEQRPDSEMAQDWCVAYGVLEEKAAGKLYHMILNRKGGKRRSVDISNSPTKKKKPMDTASAKSYAPRRLKDDDDVVGDTGLLNCGYSLDTLTFFKNSN